MKDGVCRTEARLRQVVVPRGLAGIEAELAVHHAVSNEGLCGLLESIPTSGQRKAVVRGKEHHRRQRRSGDQHVWLVEAQLRLLPEDLLGVVVARAHGELLLHGREVACHNHRCNTRINRSQVCRQHPATAATDDTDLGGVNPWEASKVVERSLRILEEELSSAAPKQPELLAKVIVCRAARGPARAETAVLPARGPALQPLPPGVLLSFALGQGVEAQHRVAPLR
mmetsp:Transcript_107932/g.344059  ORF Transcript_107932/g.344059 Transcript_107932/m.344059 type:complete len:226 (-) Transcript_107932:14-691(-)